MTEGLQANTTTRSTRRTEQVAVFSIGEFGFAISAASVQEIRSTDSLGGAVMELQRPLFRKVRHIVRRDSRSYYVVSGFEHFHLRPSRPGMVLILRGTPVAVLVDRIQEMAEMKVLLELPQSFRGEERAWYRGLTVLDRRVLPVVNPAGFLSGDELGRLDDHNKKMKDGLAAPGLEGARG